VVVLRLHSAKPGNGVGHRCGLRTGDTLMMQAHCAQSLRGHRNILPALGRFRIELPLILVRAESSSTAERVITRRLSVIPGSRHWVPACAGMTNLS